MLEAIIELVTKPGFWVFVGISLAYLAAGVLVARIPRI